MIGNLVVLVIVHTFDDINFSVLRKHSMRTGRAVQGRVDLTFGHGPFPRSLERVVSIISPASTRIYARTNMRAKSLDTLGKDQIPPRDLISTYRNPTGLYQGPG